MSFDHLIRFHGEVHQNEVRDIWVAQWTRDRVLQKKIPIEILDGAFNEIASGLKKRSG
jgi:hypothetical protein